MILGDREPLSAIETKNEQQRQMMEYGKDEV